MRVSRIRNNKPFIAALLVGLSLALVACSQDWVEDAGSDALSADAEQGDTLSGDTPQFQAPVVVLLEDKSCFESMEFVGEGRDEMIFHFSCDPSSVDIEVGDVVAGVYDGGYLARVIAMELDEASLHLWTEFIPLAEAVGDGEFELDLSGNGGRSLIDLSGKTLYRETFAGVHVESGFRSGYINIRPETHLDAAMQWGRLKRFDAIVGLRADANFEYYVAASGAHRIDHEVPIDDVSIPFAFVVEGIPVTGRLQLEFFVRFLSETTGYVDMTLGSYQGHWDWQTGGRYRSETGWDAVWDKNLHSELNGVDLVGDAGWKGRIEFSVRPSLKFYETISLSGLGATYLSGRADPGCDGIDSSFRDGLRASMSLSVRFLDRLIPDMPLTVPLGVTDSVLYESTIPWPGDLPNHLLPLCGGDAPWNDGPLVQPQSLYCGDTMSGDTEHPVHATQLLNGYSCNVGNYEAPEVVYAWTAPTTGEVTFRLVDASPTAVNHDLFALEGDSFLAPTLLGGTCVSTGMNSLVFEAQAGQTYLLVVDGYATDAGPYQVLLEC